MIIISNQSGKNVILNRIQKENLKNIKFMTKKEFIHSFYFDYDEKTIYELCTELNISCDSAKIYLENLYYVENKKYNIEKLDKLVKIKNYLDRNKLLKYDLLFREYLKNNNVIFFNSAIDKFDEIMISELSTITNVKIENISNEKYIPVIYEFNNLDEEVEFVAFKICELIDSNISTSNIKIAGINDEYTNSIRRIFNEYNLKIRKKINLYSTTPVKLFIENYNSDINKTIKILKESKCDIDILNKIIDVVNKYNFVNDYELVKDYIICDLRQINIEIHYNNEIEIIDINDIVDDDTYVFYMNYNIESVPKIYLDDNYITDDIRNNTKLDTTDILNKKHRERLEEKLTSIKNLIITYKLKSPFASFSKANILDIESQKGIIPTNKNYSTLSNKINLTKMFDELVKYGKEDENLPIFNNHYKIEYNSFNNEYKKIDERDMFKYLDNKLTLSYTSMNDYYKCSFRYYLKYILRVEKNEDNITKFIGSIFHYVLENGLYSDLGIDCLIEEYIKDNEIIFNEKEQFFLNKLKEELPFLISTIRKQDENILLKKRLFEQKIEIEYKDKIDIKFVGVIDKIIYEDNIYALIDYKTGNSKIDLSLNYYGINMQLAIYLYLANNKFKNAHFAGFYLQHVLNKLNKSDSLEKKELNLKLVGYSNSSYIYSFDNSYKDSKIIKSLKMKNDGNFYSNSKVLTEDEINSLIKLASTKVKEAIEGITSREFKINPKNIDGKNIGCEYCNYKDICFMKNKDVIYLEKQENFL